MSCCTQHPMSRKLCKVVPVIVGFANLQYGEYMKNNVSGCTNKALKNLACMGFEPVTSVILVQRSYPLN